VITGTRAANAGPEIRAALRVLARDFERIARP
jgi:hypothetical protein